MSDSRIIPPDLDGTKILFLFKDRIEADEAAQAPILTIEEHLKVATSNTAGAVERQARLPGGQLAIEWILAPDPENTSRGDSHVSDLPEGQFVWGWWRKK